MSFVRVSSRVVCGVFLLACTLPACDLLNAIASCDQETDPNCEDPARAQITGKITLPGAGGASVGVPFQRVDGALAASIKLAMTSAQATRVVVDRAVTPTKTRVPHASSHNKVPRGKTEAQRFRGGEAIVRARVDVNKDKPAFAAQLEGYLRTKMNARVSIGLCGRPDRCVALLHDDNGKLLGLEETQEAALWLNDAPFLRYAEKNLILQIQAQPNDEFYSLQWHYSAIDAQAAWDITTGDPSRVAAIVDTGILVNHPDLAARITVGNGADLISDAEVSNDGDGRDMDGTDPGDKACGADCHSFHGSHVAGTIGADTNNGVMVAGITWEGALLPVRVLGAGGGSLSDIADGIYWAAGFDQIEGVEVNEHRADVINMSLGGQGDSQAMNDAVHDAVGEGVIVLVAAGNDNQNADGFTPSNAPDAITVAAVGNVGGSRTTPQKASYSNFGTKVDIAAPGGEQAEDIDNDGQPDGVLSTLNDFVGFYQGTSMATPHVAGIAMLLKSVDPTLTQEQVRTILKDSSNPDMQCPQGCGAGRVSAAAALYAVNGGLAGPRVVGAPSSLRIGKGTLSTPIVYKNLGTVGTTITIEAPGGANRDQCEVDSAGGAIGPSGAQLAATVTVARSGDDRGECTVTATYDGGSAEVRVVWTPDAIAQVQTVDVGALKIADDGSFTVERLVQTTAIERFEYKLFNVTAGRYLVVGLVDGNNDGDYDDAEDAAGVYVSTGASEEACTSATSCGRVALKAGQTFKDANFVVTTGFGGDDGTGGTGTGGLGAACSAGGECAGGLYCDTDLPGGYCTSDCFSDTDCSGGLCFPLASADLTYQVCLKSCDVTADCGRADYICDGDFTCYPP